MNSKKTKNKQKHKPPTPQPKAEVFDVAEEKPDQIQQVEVQVKTEAIKNEERVPEIMRENVQPNPEIKLPESDAPKKPKRNRNKKKKGDKGGDAAEPLDELVLDGCKNVGENQGIKDSSSTDVKTTLTPEVTPAARRKKNKNKKGSNQIESQADQEFQLSPITKGEELTDLKIITVGPVNTEATEETKSKKKNKKKKRTDSERSDKSEEILSCTAAFQKLLENKDVKRDPKLEIGILPEEITVLTDPQGSSSKTEIELLKPESTKRDKSSENKNQLKEEGGKGKKKNKKDKKNPQKDESDDEALKPLQTKTETDSEGQTVTVPTDNKMSVENIAKKPAEACQIDTKILMEEKTIEKEKSPKPKAKIAKPVEKKQIGNQNLSSTENLTKKEPESVSSAELKNVVTEMSTKVKPASKPQVEKPVVVEKPVIAEKQQEIKPADVNLPKVEEIKQEKIIPEPIVSELKSDKTEQSSGKIPETAKIQLPESGTGKKRKKSPKPKSSKTVETTDQPRPVTPTPIQAPAPAPVLVAINPEKVPSTPQETPKQKEISQATEIKIEQQHQEVKSSKINEPAHLSFEVLSQQEDTQRNILITPDITGEQEAIKEITKTAPLKKEIPAEKSADRESIQVPEAHMEKTRKKSPKPQKKSGKPGETAELATSSTTNVPKVSPEEIKCELKTPEPSSTTNVPKVSPEEIKCELKTPEPQTQTAKDFSQQQSMTDSLIDLPVLEDIEIHSVKADESEGSACDITPDIHYPRASSQLLDNNNNTSIQDVTATDVKLNIPNIIPDTLLIQGTIETPLPPADHTHPGVTITEISTPVKEGVYKPSDKTEDKTDLKSKVLDVNIGMEELRRSIERSLAELSSMEKSEKEAEDQFFKAQAKLEHISQMATKKSEEKKQEKPVEPLKPQVQEKNTREESQDIKLHTDERKPVPTLDETVNQPIQPQPTPIIEEKKADITETPAAQTPPVPARKDNKGKNRKKKGKQDFDTASTATTTTTQSSTGGTTGGSTTSAATSDTKEPTQETKKEEKSEQKTGSSSKGKGKQQSASLKDDTTNENAKKDSIADFEPIENFEDALYASINENEQDVNKTFEMIAIEATKCDESLNPEINVTAPVEDEDTTKDDSKKHEKVNPVSQPKNLLGHPNIPARLNKTDYKKEKNKPQTPNTKQANVHIKDAVPIEVTKESKESQTENKRRFLKDKTVTESITSITSENEEYIYKYSFRKVYLPNACHVCKKDLKCIRIPCNFCNLIFYCSLKHKDEDYSQHQGLCFAVSTIVHMKDQKHIYASAKNITGHEYRLLRMQMIVSCEKVLKRRLVPWEQEALLYPRICADASCREWRHNKLVDCEGCGQVSYCSDDPTHLPRSHQRWCKSYSLYNKLVVYQQTRGRLEPYLPTRVMPELYQIPEKLNEVLASMYEEKIDMTDIQYAALTQIATAPLTAAYCHQLYNNKMNTIYANGVIKKSSFTIHVVGAELQFEADALNKWEVFFLHLRPEVKDLRIVLIGPDLNPSKLPLDLLAKIKLCENCRQNKRRVLFDFQDNKTYSEYWSTDFSIPDLVCAFNPSIERSSVFNGKDTWPSTIKCILKLKVPFIITSYTMSELQNDLVRIKECSDVEVHTISDAEFNAFASVRPDRNFISDDEMPLLFKNYCFASVCGAI